MKVLVALCLTFVLVGCSTKTTEISHSYELPDGLKDCKVYYLQSKEQQNITVLRCPNSQTHVHYSEAQGKSIRYYDISAVEV
ncbi:hypothetical protein FKOIJHOC_00080 [Acinetobacter phage Ab_121]|nr:hypothetical protein FKOIJHOC_00080 [Acinetobacter phage Ab_121]QQV88833.1 hypothetical protein Liucustia_133 [Acinetobacter phage Liucustia]